MTLLSTMTLKGYCGNLIAAAVFRMARLLCGSGGLSLACHRHFLIQPLMLCTI